MKLLLDTHIWIWALTKPRLLNPAVRKRIENPKSQIFLSPVSIWELSHLIRKGRFKFRQGSGDSLNDMLTRIPLSEAPFNFAVASAAYGIELPEGDPGDVFIAATALVFELVLVTADSQLLACSWLKTLANG